MLIMSLIIIDQMIKWSSGTSPDQNIILREVQDSEFLNQGNFQLDEAKMTGDIVGLISSLFGGACIPCTTPGG